MMSFFSKVLAYHLMGQDADMVCDEDDRVGNKVLGMLCEYGTPFCF